MAPLTVRVAAERLGVSCSALKQWIYKGTVRTVRTGGGHHRVPEGEVDRMLAAQGKVSRTRAGRPRATRVVVSAWGVPARTNTCAAAAPRSPGPGASFPGLGGASAINGAGR